VVSVLTCEGNDQDASRIRLVRGTSGILAVMRWVLYRIMRGTRDDYSLAGKKRPKIQRTVTGRCWMSLPALDMPSHANCKSAVRGGGRR
jgi:hypothetical protein